LSRKLRKGEFRKANIRQIGSGVSLARLKFASWTRQVWPIHTFVRRMHDLVAAGLELENQIPVGHLDKLMQKPALLLRVAIFPAPVAFVRETAIAQIDRRPAGSDIGESGPRGSHRVTFNTNEASLQ
jgi:hypothetical protein